MSHTELTSDLRRFSNLNMGGVEVAKACAAAADEIDRLRNVIRDAAERRLEEPNGIWSMPHRWAHLKSDLLCALAPLSDETKVQP